MIEDLARAALPELTGPSRQPDPAEAPPSPEDGGPPDARGTTSAAAPAALVEVPGPRQPADDPLPRPEPVVDLSVERGGRSLATFLLLAAAVTTTLSAGVAYADPGGVTIGLTALLLAGTLALQRARSRHTVVTVTATGSRLEIRRDRARYVFDLADLRSPVDVIGVPGDRTWRVLFYRRGMSPYVLDTTMADPEAFMRVLHAHRSEVHYRPR